MVERISTAGTLFSEARSGPVWQPTQMRCSPRRIQNQPCSWRNGCALLIEEDEANRLIGGRLDEKGSVALHGRRAHCDRVAGCVHASPAAPARARSSIRLRAKGAHRAPADWHSSSRAARRDAALGGRAARAAPARPGSRRAAPDTVFIAAAEGLHSGFNSKRASRRRSARAHQPLARRRLRDATRSSRHAERRRAPRGQAEK